MLSNQINPYFCLVSMGRKEFIAELNKQLETVENDELLKYIGSLININTDIAEPYKLTQSEAQAVQEGWADYKNGNFTSEEDFDKELDEWQKG